MDDKQFTNRVWENDRWAISKAFTRGSLIIIDVTRGTSEYVIVHEDGRVDYDSLDRIPRYVRDIISGMARAGFHEGSWKRDDLTWHYVWD